MRYVITGIFILISISQASDGKVVCNADNLQLFPKIVKGPGNGAYILFADNRASSGAWEVYVQRMDGSLNRLWGQGKLLSHDPRVSIWHGHRLSGELISSIKGSDTGAIAVWINHHNLEPETLPSGKVIYNYPAGIYARRISSSGALDWDSTRTISHSTSGFSACSDGAGGCVIVALDKDNKTIRVWRLDSDGDFVTGEWKGQEGKVIRVLTKVFYSLIFKEVEYEDRDYFRSFDKS